MNLSSLETAYAKHYLNRNAFYLSERDRILSEMPEAEEIQKLLGQRREPLVAVCGTTQVGKTTLILKLMGVSQEQQGDSTALLDLAKALRGNLRLISGEGGTPTAITYRWSSDGSFHLRTNLGESTSVSTLDELKQWLQEVRDAMKAGDIKATPDAWYRIDIPKQFAGPSPQDIVLVDTPGKDVANKAEISHIEDIYRGIVATSTLVIFVEHSNKIARLPNHAVPGLGGLMEFANRCALVLTHAFSEKSIAKILPESEFSAEWIQNRMAEEISEYIDWSPSNLFPLEYGHTWQGLLKDFPERAARIHPVIETILGLLHAKMVASLHPDEMVRQFLGVERQIVTIYDRRLKDTRSALLALGTACAKVHAEIEELDVALIASRNDFAKIEGQLSLVSAKLDEVDGWLRSANFPTWGVEKMPDKPPNHVFTGPVTDPFTDHLTRYRDELAKFSSEQLEGCMKDFFSPLCEAGIDIDYPDWSSDKVRDSMIEPWEWRNWCDADSKDWDYNGFWPITWNWRPSEAFWKKHQKAIDAACTMLNGGEHLDGLSPFLRRTLREQIKIELTRLEKRLCQIEATIQEASDHSHSLQKKRLLLEVDRSAKEETRSTLEKDKDRCTALARLIPSRLLEKFSREQSSRFAALGNLPIHEQIAELVWIHSSANRLKGFLNT